MHINDTYALRGLLRAVRADLPTDPRLVAALLAAVEEDIAEFEARLEIQALAEEARQQ